MLILELNYIIDNDNYSNLKDVLKSHFLISNRLLTKLKKSESIYLNGKFTYLDHPVTSRDEIKVIINFEEDNSNIVPTKMDLDIIYEDDSFLVINKPAHIAIHPSILHYDNSLSNGVKYYFDTKNIHKKIRIVNRLDKDTSGVVIFAKNEYIHECLIKQMNLNQFKKEYIAILEGILDKKSGTINAPIARKAGSIIEREVNEIGDFAITHYKVLQESNNLSLVQFTLETGRTHQIRVHSKYIGHPILGDTLYGNPSNLVERQALHCYKLEFIHPITHKKIKLLASRFIWITIFSLHV